VVLEVDEENRRLSLGLKQTTPNPWSVIQEKYRVGDIIKGVVRNIADFGAFVELSEGVEGLVHISEMAHERLEKPGDKFQPGQSVRVKILRVDPEERKIGLSVKAAQDELGSGDLKQYQNARQEEAARSSITLGDVAGDLSALRERAAQRQADGEPAGEPGGDKGSEG
jgi:small subunit ribosomal protein S1